jgi:hypothetical protein
MENCPSLPLATPAFIVLSLSDNNRTVAASTGSRLCLSMIVPFISTLSFCAFTGSDQRTKKLIPVKTKIFLIPIKLDIFMEIDSRKEEKFNELSPFDSY